MTKNFQACAALLLCSGIACADEPPRGFYLGAGVGQATLELEDAESPADFKGDDTGFKAIAGYRILQWVAVEASYADYGQQEDTVSGQRLESDFRSFYVAGVGMLPLGNADLFAKAGLARWEGTLENRDFPASVDEDNIDSVVGFGAQYRLGQLALRAEVEGLLLSFDDDGDGEFGGDDWVTFLSFAFTWTF